MRFAFSKTIAKSRGWVVLKAWLIAKPGKIDVLVGLMSEAPPSGRRTSFYTQPLFAPRFSLSVLSFSDNRLYNGDGMERDNASSTTALIDMFEAETDLVCYDASYKNYLLYLDQLVDDDTLDRLDYYCLTKVYLYVMAGEQERARELLTIYGHAPRGPERERMDASADRLREALNRSLEDARELVRGIAKYNRQAIGLEPSRPVRPQP